MKHISEIIEDILVEWAYRVHDGMPNPTNPQHIIELRESMEELNLPNNVIYEVIENLINEKDIVKNKKSGNTYAVAKHNKNTQTLVKKNASDDDIKNVEKGDDKDDDTQTSIYEKPNTVTGNSDDGDNKVKNEMLEHGYNGMEDATGKKPAPGNPGSAFNEIVSGEGIHMLDENPVSLSSALTELAKQLARK